MRGGPEDSSLLSLTFDQGTPGDAKPAKRRPRSAGRTLRASFAAPVAAGAPAPAGARGAGRAVPAAQGDARRWPRRAAEGRRGRLRRRALTSFLRLLGFSLVF